MFIFRRPYYLSLQNRLVVVLIIAAICFILAHAVIGTFFVYPSYKDLERRKGADDIERCVNALGNEISHLDQVAHDWAAWDDTYSFIANPNDEYVFSNLQMSTFVDNNISLFFFVSRQGEVVWGKIIDQVGGDVSSSVDFPMEKWPLEHPLLKKRDQHTRGLLMSDVGPLLIASRPILRTDNSGPEMGTLVIGRLLSDSLIHRLEQQTLLTWTIEYADSTKQSAFPLEVDVQQHKNKRIGFQDDGEHLVVTTLYDDINGKAEFLVRTEINRDITRQGMKTLSFVFACSILLVLVVFEFLLILLKRLIVEPVNALTNQVVQIHESGDLTPLAKSPWDDNIGVLTKEINRFIQKLSKHQSQLRAFSTQILVTEENDRRQFARDLHDRVSQGLAMIKLRLDRMAASSPTKVLATEAGDLSLLLSQLIEETRTLTFELSPPMLYEIGFCAALEWLIETFKEQHNLRITYSCQEVPKEKGSTFTVMVFQIVRELLTNVVKHAKAADVSIRTSIDSSDFITIVSDNGIGLASNFEMGAVGNLDGFGLFSIRERIISFGGRLDIYSQPGKGMTVTFSIPLGDIDIHRGNGGNFS